MFHVNLPGCSWLEKSSNFWCYGNFRGGFCSFFSGGFFGGFLLENTRLEGNYRWNQWGPEFGRIRKKPWDTPNFKHQQNIKRSHWEAARFLTDCRDRKKHPTRMRNYMLRQLGKGSLNRFHYVSLATDCFFFWNIIALVEKRYIVQIWAAQMELHIWVSEWPHCAG